MSNHFYFELIIFSLVVIIGLELLAKRLGLPPAAAQLIGGACIAFLPGLPAVEIDPEFVLLVFLPPLLMDGAYLTAWAEFKRNISGILLLAVGAVIFTTLVVGYLVHFLVPSLPWSTCFALGAIVSPPDAIAAKAVLQRVPLPRKVMVLLEGESMLNDATGLVLYKFSIASALTGAFSLTNAVGDFIILGVGGIAVGALIGYFVIKLFKQLTETYLVIVASILPAWICYIAGERVGVSGVIATVTYGMILGWHQHESISASVRRRGTAFWQVLTFILESLVFILIGLSLRGVIGRISDADQIQTEYGYIVAAIVLTVVLTRFVWVFAVDGLAAIGSKVMRGYLLTLNPVKFNPVKVDSDKFDWRIATIKSWAGMRGVVTLAIALALPSSFPGRDLIFITSFAVILVTVLVQGVTIGSLITLLKIDSRVKYDQRFLTEPQSWAKIAAAQYAAVEKLAYDESGSLLHPRLLEQYGYRASIANQHKDQPELPMGAVKNHYDIILAAIAAGREELLHLHRSGELQDELLHTIEHDLDLQEIAAMRNRGS